MFFIISCSLLLRMKNVSDKSCRENRNTHFMFKNFFRKSCRLWDNVKKKSRAEQATDEKRRMRIACWKAMTLNTHSSCVMLITFPLQHWFYERASMVRYTYIAFLVMNSERQYRDYVILPLIIAQRDFHLVHAGTLHKSQRKWLNMLLNTCRIPNWSHQFTSD